MSDPVTALPIGGRVVVRSRLGGPFEGRPDPAAQSGPTLTDAVGTLVSVDEQTLVVQTRRGLVRIARDRVVAAKEVPPAPRRRGAAHLAITVDDLARVTAATWGAVERERLGDWELRASSGFTQRGNSVVAVGSPGVPLTVAVDRVQDWYAARGLRACVSLAGPVGFRPTDDPLGAELVSRGYLASVATDTLTARTDAVGAAPTSGPEVVVTDSLEESWLTSYRRSRTTVPFVTEAVLTGSPRQLFGSIAPGGGISQQLGVRPRAEAGTPPVAIGRVGLASGWAGLGAVWTDPAFRRRGLAQHLTAALARAVLADGIRLVHLQVEADNEPALALYRQLGFEAHSSYVYLTAPAA